jgi:tetratricopeptide (TPR) repeat protein
MTSATHSFDATHPQASAEAKESLYFNKSAYTEQIHKLSSSALRRFQRIVRVYALFNMFFLALGFSELVLLAFFFVFLIKTSFLAISLAIIFLTGFSYFVLRLYYQTKKPEQLVNLRERFIETCKGLLQYQEGIVEHHLALANASCKLAAHFDEKEYSFYTPPVWLEIIGPPLQKLSCWWHWEDVLLIKELLLSFAIEEHIKLVKCEPTNLEAHAALANAYVMLSSLYVDPQKVEDEDEDHWIPPGRYTEGMHQRYRTIAERAIEEFQILNDYAPNDVWVHAQLAYSYHDLQMPEEEIREYEAILRLRPDDRETLFKLGVRYFQQGHNAKGLRVYQDLKRCHYKKADDLIRFYGSR